MVELTRLNNTKFSINPYLVEIIESTPDTVIVMNSGKKYLVQETVGEIGEKISQFLSENIRRALVQSSVKINQI